MSGPAGRWGSFHQTARSLLRRSIPFRHQPPASFSGRIMGTCYGLTLVDLPHRVDAGALHEQARLVLEGIEARMSTYRQDSEITRFNATDRTDWFAVSPETARCVVMAIEIAGRSGGTYDITVGPLVNLWGFGPPPRPAGIPDPVQIEQARLQTGMERMDARLNPPALRKSDAGVRIDLASIAKGFAADRAAEALESAGVEHYCLDVGGEVRVRGHNPHGRAWQVAIETPTAGQRCVQRMVPLHAGSIATSGDYRIFTEREGVRYAHLIDPRTGRPACHDLVSVSVLDASCARADAWATALCVAGPKEGAALAERERLSALFILRTPDGFIERVYGRGWPTPE